MCPFGPSCPTPLIMNSKDERPGLSTYLESVKDGGEVSPLSVVSPLSEYLWVCGAPVLVRHRVHRLVVVVVHGPGDAVPGEPTVDFTRRHLDLSRHKIEKYRHGIILQFCVVQEAMESFAFHDN